MVDLTLNGVQLLVIICYIKWQTQNGNVVIATVRDLYDNKFQRIKNDKLGYRQTITEFIFLLMTKLQI